MKFQEDDPKATMHQNCCVEQNVGVNNFGIHPSYIPSVSIRNEVGSHMLSPIIRKCLHVL